MRIVEKWVGAREYSWIHDGYVIVSMRWSREALWKVYYCLDAVGISMHMIILYPAECFQRALLRWQRE